MPSNSPLQKPRLQHSGFAVLRTPLLPFDDFLRWSALVSCAKQATGGGDNNGPSPAPQQRASLELLRDFVSRPEFIDAVRIASPAMHDALADWLAGRGKTDAKRLEQSLIRYFSRASHRATPFGLFAGCSLMSIGATTTLELCPRGEYSRRSRLDMDHVAELTRIVKADTEARRQLTLFANTSATPVGGRLQYVETRYVGRVRKYLLTAVESTSEILEVLSRAEHGARYGDLVELLEGKDFERDEIDEFLLELLDTQLLVADAEPQLTGDEASAVLANDLSGVGHGREISDALRTVNADLERIDALGVGCSSYRYDSALSPLNALPVPVDPSKILQVDLFKPSARLSLSSAVVDDLVFAAELLPSLMVQFDPLAEFVERFGERYETREVPLLEALDDEVGVGFPETTTNDRVMRQFGDRIRRREAWLAELRVRAARMNMNAVELDNGDIARLRSSDQAPTCDAVAVLATLLAATDEKVNLGEYQVLVHLVLGPSGARMLGRFAHLDSALESGIREHLRAEEVLQPNAIFAEIVHLPQGRIGNIAARPVLRDYEISYLGRGGGTRQLRLSDLTVTVRQGRVSVRSTSLDREVIPRLTCAHNYRTGRELPVYRFLASLQDHGVTGSASWSWGVHASAPSLPRVTRDRLILAPAMWTLGTEEIRPLAERQGSSPQAFERWRDTRGLPRYVTLVDGDNRMPVDCDNPRSVETLLHLIRRRTTATLEEMLQTPDSLCVRGPEGRFTNELLVPLVRVASTASTATDVSRHASPQRLRAAAASAVRRYPPGSEWVYAKLYCGKGSGDLVLRGVVAPLVEALTDDALIAQWFFVRYSDPQFHIRLRVRARDGQLGRIMELVGAACAEAVANGRIARVVYDTYQAEVERYGGATGITLAESLFHYDSIAALEVVSRPRDDTENKAGERDMIALAGLERYFEDAEIGLSERIVLLERRLEGTAAAVRRQRSVAFRARRSTVAHAVAQSRAVSEHTWLTTVLDHRSARSRLLLRELRELDSRGELMGRVDDMLFSFTHMWVNRVMPVVQGIEPVLYDMLHRHYLSERARTVAPSGVRIAGAVPQ